MCRQTLIKLANIKFHKILSAFLELLPAYGQMDRHMAKLIGALLRVDTPKSVGKQPYLEWNQNTQLQCSSGRRSHTPYTALPLLPDTLATIN
jgi:hypothetical protein